MTNLNALVFDVKHPDDKKIQCCSNEWCHKWSCPTVLYRHI